MECKEQHVELSIQFQQGFTLRAWDIHPSEDGVTVTIKSHTEDSQTDFLGGRLYIVERKRDKKVVIGFDMSQRQRDGLQNDQNESQNMCGVMWEMSSSMFWSMPNSLTDMLTEYESANYDEELDMILAILGPHAIESICTSEPGDEDEFYDIHTTDPHEAIELLNWRRLERDVPVAMAQLKWLAVGSIIKGKVWLDGNILRFRQMGKTKGQENPDNYGWELSQGQIRMLPKSLKDLIQTEP
jgi:hypothetical protein